MSERVYWLLEVEILPGHLENFKSVARDLIASTQSEADTLAYEWNLTEDQTACHIFESYRDSAALIAHVHGFGKFAERFMLACRPTRFDVYGPANAEAKAILADFGPRYYAHLGGFSR